VKATFIFDFDGTIADTFPLVIDISYKLSGGARRLATKRIELLRRLPLLEAIRALGVRKRYLPRLILFTRRRMYPYMADVEAFENVPEMIRALHADGHRLFILSSNKKRNIQAFLDSHDLSRYFTDVAGVYYGSIFYKMYGLHKLLRRYDIKKERCYYIGNEPLDIRSAERVGLKAVAVTWSGQSRDELALTDPDVIVDQPRDIVKLARGV
jgi:phosphoglycolate phosphatase-like HAD superfamily hydrolase